MARLRGVTGCVLRSDTDEPLDVARLSAGTTLQHVRRQGDTRWDEFVLRSRTPLRGEEQPMLSGLYEYPILIRRSGSRAFLVAETRLIVQFVLDNVLNGTLRLGLHRREINIDRLVRLVTTTPETYVLSFVHARLAAATDALRAMSFYGDDIGESVLFREQLPRLNPYACGLRHLDAGNEVARLRRDGFITFSYANGAGIRAVDAVLHYVSVNDGFQDS